MIGAARNSNSAVLRNSGEEVPAEEAAAIDAEADGGVVGEEIHCIVCGMDLNGPTQWEDHTIGNNTREHTFEDCVWRRQQRSSFHRVGRRSHVACQFVVRCAMRSRLPAAVA